MQTKNVLEMKDYDVEVKSDLCSQYFYFSVYYAYPEKDVSDLFTERQNAEEDFAHEELLQMFYDVSNGLINLSKKDATRELGYLQMNKIFWDDEAQNFNIIENFMNKKINETYMTIILSRNPFAVLSPEVLVRNKTAFDNINRFKIDAFNLGMVILCLGLGIKPGQFYNIKYTKINSDLLKKSIANFNQKYHENPLLCSIVRDLLVEEPGLRMDIKAVKQKYPTQDQVSVFLKSNSHASTEINMYRNSRPTKSSINHNSNSYNRMNSFQNNSNRTPQYPRSGSYTNSNQKLKYPNNVSLRGQIPNGMISTNKKKLPIQFANQPSKFGNQGFNGVTSLSPQYPNSGKVRVARKQMSMGNFNGNMYGRNHPQQFQYGKSSGKNVNQILKQGDADFFNS
jgi:hypothetical protein